jgi:surface protein
MAITTNCLMFDNQQLLYDGTGILYNEDPLNPLNLPPYTIRLLYKDGVTPSFSKGTGIQVSQSPNIWDLTYNNNNWSSLLYRHGNLLEILGGNTTGVKSMEMMCYDCTSLVAVNIFDTSTVITMEHMFHYCKELLAIPLFNTISVENMHDMFYICSHLQSVPLLNTTNVTNMNGTFAGCTSLTAIPLFDTSNVTNMEDMLFSCTSLIVIPLFNTSKVTNMLRVCYDCPNVESGALALYQQASTQVTPPANHSLAFWHCGKNTVTGAAELAQIPSDWK